MLSQWFEKHLNQHWALNDIHAIAKGNVVIGEV